MEFVSLRKQIKKSDNHVKFNSSSVILDYQRSPFDKYGLGFKKLEDKLKEDMWSPRLLKLDPHPSQEKAKIFIYLDMTTKILGVQECNKELVLSLKANSSEEKQLQEGTNVPSMKIDLMVTVFLVLTLVIRLWIAE